MAGDTYNILINDKSGTVLNMGTPAIEAAITNSGIAVNELCFSEPTDMADNLKRLAAMSQPLLVGGGDGTIRECAKSLAKQKKPFGVLPFGTMNLLAHDLNINTLAEALKAYANGSTAEAIDAGFVNDEIFLCCASIGTMPQASVYREENRKKNNFLLIPQMFLFVLANLEKNKKQRIVLEVDGEMRKFHSAGLVIADNRFADSDKLTESNFKRASLKEGELAAYVATTKTQASHLRFLMRLLFGHWLKDPDMTEIIGKRMKLWTRRKRELVSIDGEVVKLDTPLSFTLKPHHVQVLIPTGGE